MRLATYEKIQYVRFRQVIEVLNRTHIPGVPTACVSCSATRSPIVFCTHEKHVNLKVFIVKDLLRNKFGGHI
jgi:hypothetical protein